MNKNNIIEKLTLEQQLQLQILERDIEDINLEQAKEYLLEAFRQIMFQENYYQEVIREFYGYNSVL